MESLAWEPRGHDDLIPPSICRRHAGPYDAAVLPEIAGARPRLPIDVVTLADEASNEIARFDAEMGSAVAPFAAILLRSESASSSQIENLSSGAKQIAVAELGLGSAPNAAMIVANVRAMTVALTLAHRLDRDAILEMHRTLMSASDPASAGRWRTEPVWVGGDGYGPHGAAYVAPQHGRVSALVDDLVAFIARHDVPALTHAALAHAQFENIHPFTDGNGRTGRALLHAMTHARGLTRRVTVPVSAGLLVNPEAYVEALVAYRDGDIAPIVVSVSEASFAAVTNGRMLASDIAATRERWQTVVKARSDSSAWRLADLMLRRGVVDAPTVAAELGVSVSNAMRPITALADAGVLTPFAGPGRRRMWQARDVLEALDAFAARAGRRRLQ